MAGLTVDQLSSSFDARLDNNAQNLLLFSGSFNTRLEEFQAESVLGKVNTLSGSHTTLSASFTSNSSSFNSRINTIKASELALSASVSSDVTSVKADIDSLNDFSASITSSFNSLSASVNSSSASFASRINTLRAGGVTFDDFNALTQSLSGVISSSAQLNNATITNLTITNLTTINETASVVFSSGSNQFGDNLADNHILSGSVYIVGSGSLNGYTLLTSNNTSSFLTSLNGALSSSAQVLDGSGIFSSSAQLPSGLVSASSQLPSGLVSASSQVLDGSGIFSSSAQLPAGLVSASSQVLGGSGIFSSSAQLPAGLISSSINTGSFATTGSNQFTGSQNINGDVIITGSTLSVKKSTDSDPFFIVDADSKRLALVQGNGEIPGEFYLALSGSSAFFPRPEKTLLYGARGFKFQTNQGTVSEFTGSLTISSSAAVDLNVIGALNVTGSLNVSSSNSINWYMPQLSLYQRNPSEAQSGLTMNHWNNTLGAYSSLQLYAFSNESWIQSTEKILKISGPTVQLSGLNSDPGNVNVIGKLNVTGSMGVSGSIIPAVGSGETTSSFSLGSSTAAWKDLWVSNGTINFLGSDGTTQGTLSSTADGLQLGSATISGSLIVSSSAAVDVNVIGALNVTGKLTNGYNTTASGDYSHAEGSSTLASNDSSHAEGNSTLASGINSHAEGLYTTASAAGAHAEGSTTWASGPYSHAEGIDTKTVGQGSHAEGTGSWAGGNYSHAEGYGTRANEDYELAIGKFNAETYNSSLFVIGNGTSDSNRSNIVSVTANTFSLSGSLNISGSIVPAVGSGQYTSSFSLGSPTAAWKDIYVSDGTINFLGSTGNTIGRLSATADGLSALSLLLGTSSFGGNEVPQLYIGQGRTNNPNNVAIGVNALNSIDTSGGGADGMFNVAVGSYALSQVAAGQGNTAMGHNAMGGANGYYNTAIGNYAGYAGGGNGNVFVGYNSGRQITNTGAGGGNVALGYEALMSNGTDAYFAANVAIGNRAGYYLSGSSHNNIIIGDRTGPQGSYKQENYKLYIGDGATPLMTGSLESGNLSLSINGATTITTTLTLKPQHPLPTGALGSMAVSGSSLYFHNGTSWKGVLLDA